MPQPHRSIRCSCYTFDHSHSGVIAQSVEQIATDFERTSTSMDAMADAAGDVKNSATQLHKQASQFRV